MKAGPWIIRIAIGGSIATFGQSAAEGPRLLPALHGYTEIGWQDVELEGGFWGPRLDIHGKTTIPHCLNQLEERRHIANFDTAAKVVAGVAAAGGPGDPQQATKALEGDAGNHDPAGGAALSATAQDKGITGHSAFDSDLHKAMEGACYTLGHRNDEALRQRLEGIVDRVLTAQEKDGYLVTWFTAREPQNRWTDLRTNHEMYNAGHFFEFAVAHHQLQGDTPVLEAAKRFADLIDRTFGPDKRYDVDGHEEIELALIKLYRATGEKRYLELCRFLVDERGHAHGMERKPFVPGPFIEPPRPPGLTDHQYGRLIWRAKLYWRNGRMQDHKPLLEQSEAVGHAVRAGYIYAAMADLARFSDAPEYAASARRLWQDVVDHKMYLTGGLGTAQYGDEGFGDPYHLPNRTYCESCANIANVLWQHRMCLLEGDAKYADAMELALYNSAISGMSLTGDSFFYQNPLESHDGALRSPWIGLACCPTNLARLTPQIGGLIYGLRGEDLLVNLYAQGTATIHLADGRQIGLRQQTRYPWDGRVRLTLDPQQPTALKLHLRIPGWARGIPAAGGLYRFADAAQDPVIIRLNGQAVDARPGDHGYVMLQRIWQAGDVVELELPMVARQVLADERVSENRGKVALMRGPVVYCFEGIDNPEVDLFSVRVPADVRPADDFQPGQLGGITTIRLPGQNDVGKAVELTAIPYFAWANRGKSPMNLWLHSTTAAGQPGPPKQD